MRIRGNYKKILLLTFRNRSQIKTIISKNSGLISIKCGREYLSPEFQRAIEKLCNANYFEFIGWTERKTFLEVNYKLTPLGREKCKLLTA